MLENYSGILVPFVRKNFKKLKEILSNFLNKILEKFSDKSCFDDKYRLRNNFNKFRKFYS